MPGPIREYPLDRCDQFLAKCKAHRKAIKIFATGDSWLAAPGGWWRGASVVNRLNNDDWVHAIDPAHPGFNILSIAKVGFVVDKMPTDHDLLALDYVRGEFDRQNVPFAFDAFMVSAGGNDFIPKADTYISGGNGSATIDTVALDALFNRIKTRWGQLLQRLAPGNAPVLTNGYGPIIPTLMEGTTWLPGLQVGPWVGPWLIGHCGLTPAQAQVLAAQVVDRFNDVVSALPGLRYFDLRPTVAAIPASMWHDEIHFTGSGWERIAQQWMSAIDAAVAQTPPTPIAFAGLRLPAPAILRTAPPARKAKPQNRGVRTYARKHPAKAPRKSTPSKRPKTAAKSNIRTAAKKPAAKASVSRRRRSGR
jgi:hypothetical protein